ncbi:rhodanese-like domain-containing protein [candidate division KSB1 bacterium]|nr:rhodanese-like domain-containing protein [candidate division KSB1 bacterium]NIR72294.1 rhodanese-like domain-containing protein [candidate division KSB1 bacterium]NIS26686.1 rhodanese-like domain-containing protein [candidate division KSB1 bacterium]NIT70322.1 rhodanese-like domain-containing protein [candidate division KSB1 bacterium]NIU27301.1 rhodanese-like domain-containing protein [candidate division KSB1 bacterium]
MNSKLLIPKLVCVLALLNLNCANNSTHKTRVPENPSLTVEQVKSIIDQDTDVVLLDVRTEAEFHGELGHLKNALLIPVQELETRYTELEPYRNERIIVYCRSGGRSSRATQFLRDKGFEVQNMQGGMRAWRARFGKEDTN